MTAVWRKAKPALTVARAVLIAAPTLSGISVTTDKPGTRPAKYIVLELVDSDYPNPAFTEPRVLANCHATTSTLAGDLADEVLAVFLNARGLFGGAFVKKFANPQGPYKLNDPDISDRQRYQVYGELRLSSR